MHTVSLHDVHAENGCMMFRTPCMHRGHATILLSILVRSTSVGDEIWRMTMSLSSPVSRISSLHRGAPQPCEGQTRGKPTEGLDTYSTRQLLQKAWPHRCRSICECCEHAEHRTMFAELMAAITGASFAYASSNSAWVCPATTSMLASHAMPVSLWNLAPWALSSLLSVFVTGMKRL